MNLQSFYKRIPPSILAQIKSILVLNQCLSLFVIWSHNKLLMGWCLMKVKELGGFKNPTWWVIALKMKKFLSYSLEKIILSSYPITLCSCDPSWVLLCCVNSIKECSMSETSSNLANILSMTCLCNSNCFWNKYCCFCEDSCYSFCTTDRIPFAIRESLSIDTTCYGSHSHP